MVGAAAEVLGVAAAALVESTDGLTDVDDVELSEPEQAAANTVNTTMRVLPRITRTVSADKRQSSIPGYITALMALSCCIRGSFWAWESWWVAAESE